VTTRGFIEADMVEIADIITLVVEDFEKNKGKAVERVKALVTKYPIYGG
jgi:glycine/serine hydroxymethyltransferase